MPQGQILPYSPGQYPELDGLVEGDKVNFNGQATIVKTRDSEEGNEGEGSMGLQIDQIELDPEDTATKTLKSMTQNDNTPAPSNGGQGGGF